MKILVTGGTGVVGSATVTELLRRGHEVRLLTRHADEDVKAWDGKVTSFACDVADGAALAGAADSCDAVIHIAGISAETPPDDTFERINIGGTRNLLEESHRVGVRRFIFVSTLGVDRVDSDYHRSKLRAEEIVRAAPLEWVIARTGPVVGPGDDTVSVILRMVRTLPVVPVLGGGDQPFQPVWHEDLACALAACVERADLARVALNLTGDDILTVNELLDTFSTLTDRSPLRLSMPAFLAQATTAVASAFGAETPARVAAVQLLLDDNLLRAEEPNDLTGRLGVTTHAMHDCLEELTDSLPEQTPADGTGKLKRRQFSIDIAKTSLDAAGTILLLREKFSDIMHVDAAAEPGAAEKIEDGATLTLGLPGRGHAQVRVQHIDDHSFTLATVEGHPLAGIVRFSTEDHDGLVRFTIDIAERAASRIDHIAMAIIGSALQKRTWRRTADNLLRATGGTAPNGLREKSWTLDDHAAEPLEGWIEDLVHDRQRREKKHP